MALSHQKAVAVLWFAELKSVSEVQQKWTDKYSIDPPSEEELTIWTRNFKACGNVNGDNGEHHEHVDLADGRRLRKRDSIDPCNETKENVYKLDEVQNTIKEETCDFNEQSKPIIPKCQNGGFKFGDDTTLENIRQMQEDFCKQRNWDQYHSPRNVLLALVGEMGELAEIFQWKSEVKEGLPEFSEAEKEHVGEEMSDILIYLVRLADRCRVDLPEAALKKFAKNAKKYPANIVYGRSNKYTHYRNEAK